MDINKKITRQEFQTIVIILFVAMFGSLGIDIHLASMPDIMSYLHTDKAHMQQSVSLFLLGAGVSLLFYGPLSDRYGRKPIVTFGLTLAALASFASIFSTSINLFLLTRLLQGLGMGVCWGLGRTMLADMFQGDRFAIISSYLGMFLSLSPLLAPALGSYILQWFGWQANFLLLGILLSLAIISFLLFCPETNKHIDPHACKLATLYQNYKELLLHPVFVGCTLLSGIAMAGEMAYATSSSFIFQTQFHLSPIEYGWITAIVGVGCIVGKIANPIAIRRMGSIKTILSGLTLLPIAGAWIALFLLLQVINVPLIMVAVFLTIFTQCLVAPSAAAKALSPFHDKRGAASALYGSFQMIASFAVSAMVGSVAHDGVAVLSVTYIILGILGMVIFVRVLKVNINFLTIRG